MISLNLGAKQEHGISEVMICETISKGRGESFNLERKARVHHEREYAKMVL